MIEIKLVWLIILCVLALLGLVLLLAFFYYGIIKPLKDMCSNYSFYKKFFEKNAEKIASLESEEQEDGKSI